ncbi:mitotic spindle checkpoint protein BUBR1-like [Zingiber officinale]|nr:mitotic spindle checkpoint protein BUBR1-like [Zingiber officinale]XP_042402209.1 mitotic spindle checkpoint protein BUBR1-like [Zingiber officinale]
MAEAEAEKEATWAAAAQADPEGAFLLLQRIMEPEEDGAGAAAGKTDGFEWELHKENVRPLKRGRNTKLLNRALKAQVDRDLKASLLQTRRRMIEAIDEYQGEDPLRPWLDCIKWVQESFPTGGECSGLVVMYEQCVRTFWHDERYQEDLRYLKVWVEYAANCADAEVIYQFLEANEIGQSHSIFYSSYAMLLESKNKFKKADEIYNLGLARKAKPIEKLEAAYRAFLVRSTMRRDKEEELLDKTLPVRSFGTVLTALDSRRQAAENPSSSKRMIPLQKISNNRPLSVYQDENSNTNDQHSNMKKNEKSWNSLGSRLDRNKENTSMPTKWTSYKVPQKGQRTSSAAPTPLIKVYVDEECAEINSNSVQAAKNLKTTTFKLGNSATANLKKETEMLKDNPLRNFPLSSLR